MNYFLEPTSIAGKYLSLAPLICYDTRDRVTSRIDQLIKTQSWTYDGINDVLTYTDRKNQKTTLHYDTLARLDKSTSADASTINYTYDAGNRMLSMADSLSGSS